MLFFLSFLVVVMVALGVIGTMISGMFILTVTACVCLGLTVILGAWTLARRRGGV